MSLPPYLKDRACPKCLQTDIYDSYCSAGDSGGYGSPGWNNFRIKDTERIDRHCRNCGYEWAEAVATPEKQP